MSTQTTPAPASSTASLEADRTRLSEHLAYVRRRSAYDGPRTLALWLAVIATIACGVALWPISVVESQYLDRPDPIVVDWPEAAIMLSALLAVWIVWAVVQAVFDRADLELRKAVADRHGETGELGKLLRR